MLLSSQWKRTRSAKRRPAMKKNIISGKKLTQDQKVWEGPITIGMDLGDRTSRYCIVDGNGGTVREGSDGTTKAGMTQIYGQRKQSRIGTQAGTHQHWISQLRTGRENDV